MPEETPSVPPVPPSSGPATPQTPPPAPTEAQTPFNIGEEFGTAKKNLPPANVVLVVLGVLVVIFAVFAFFLRSKPAGTGAIGDVVSVEVPDQNMVMVRINVSFHNEGEKPFWIRSIKADIDTGSATLSDEAASAVDLDRYFQAFPVLKQHAIVPLKREDKIPPGGDGTGTIIVVFPVTPDVFAHRKSIKVSIFPYDQPLPVVLIK